MKRFTILQKQSFWLMLICCGILSLSLHANAGTGLKTENHRPSAFLKISAILPDEFKTEDRQVSEFSAIDVSTGIGVQVSKDSKQTVKVEADAEAIHYLKTEVRGKTLRIFMDYGENNESHHHIHRLRVYITIPELTAVRTSSGSSLESKSNFPHVEKFEVEASSGSSARLLIDASELNVSSSSGSSVDLEVKAKNTRLESSSGSTLKVKGTTDELKVNSSSGSTIGAGQLSSNECNANSDSGSSVKVDVKDRLDAVASSSASISYSGNPKTVNKIKSSGASISAD